VSQTLLLSPEALSLDHLADLLPAIFSHIIGNLVIYPINQSISSLNIKSKNKISMRETIIKMGTGKMWEENEELWQSRHRLTGLVKWPT
jgi:hypothetical protein